MKVHRNLRPLVRDLKANGFQVVPGRGGHIHVRTREGKFVYAMPSSPSDIRGPLNARTDLRKMGALSG